jgi:hypothetical protein
MLRRPVFTERLPGARFVGCPALDEQRRYGTLQCGAFAAVIKTEVFTRCRRVCFPQPHASRPNASHGRNAQLCGRNPDQNTEMAPGVLRSYCAL